MQTNKDMIFKEIRECEHVTHTAKSICPSGGDEWKQFIRYYPLLAVAGYRPGMLYIQRDDLYFFYPDTHQVMMVPLWKWLHDKDSADVLPYHIMQNYSALSTHNRDQKELHLNMIIFNEVQSFCQNMHHRMHVKNAASSPPYACAEMRENKYQYLQLVDDAFDLSTYCRPEIGYFDDHTERVRLSCESNDFGYCRYEFAAKELLMVCDTPERSLLHALSWLLSVGGGYCGWVTSKHIDFVISAASHFHRKWHSSRHDYCPIIPPVKY